MAKKEKEEAKVKEKGKGMSPIILVVVALVAIGVGVFGAKMFLFKDTGSTAVKHIVEIKVPITEEAITVNLSDEGGKRYLKASITISYDETNTNLGTEIEEKTVEIKDKTMFYLKSKKAADFDASNEVTLKTELVAEINKLLLTGQIINVYFPGDLLVQ
jgi:flagellar FliL protein